MKITEFSARRPVFVSMVFLAIALFGVVALRGVPIDLFPEIEPPVMSVITFYPGASAPDVEEKVTEVIEDNLGALGDLEELRSSSSENISIVTLEFAFGTNLDEAANDVRVGMEFAKRYMPTDVEPPMLLKFDSSALPVVLFAVSSSRGSIHHDRELIDDVIQSPLKRVPGVGAVNIMNSVDRQVHIEVDQERLEAQHLTLAHIAQVIEAENVSAPAGQITTGSMEFAVRLPAEFASFEEMGQIVLARRGDAVVRLRDVARVVPGVEESLEIAKMNGRDVAIGLLMKKAGGNTVEVAGQALERIEEIRAELPDHLDIHIIQDTSRFIRLMVGNLARTLAVASSLVVLVVFLFLRRLRPSLIVALTMPASMIIALLVLYVADYTINAVSLMAMALAIGMVVDNAIVVLENITRHVEEGVAPLRAAVRGTREVAGAIIASTMTTLSIFAPLIFVSGFVGIMFGQLAVVLMATIGASLFTALTLTPMMGARLLGGGKRTKRGLFGALFAGSERLLVGLESVYAAVLRFALRQRLLVLLLSVGLVVGSGWAVSLVGVDFMPKQNSGEINISVELPVGTSKEESARLAFRIADILEAIPEAESTFFRTGTSRLGFGSALGDKEGPHIAQSMARLVPMSQRNRTDHEIADEVREILARELPEVENLTMRVGQGMGAILTGMGKPVVVEIYGSDYRAMEQVAGDVKALFQRTAGLVDVTADTFQKKPELQVIPNRSRASRMGVPVGSAALALRQSFYGQAVTKFRAHGDEVDIFLRLEPEDRAAPEDLLDVRVPAIDGRPVRLGDFARVVEGASPMEIKRKDMQRYVVVAAGVGARALGDIATDLQTGIQELKSAEGFPRGVRLKIAGEMKEQAETFGNLIFVLILGFLLVYMVMAAQFESLLDPFVIMFSVPFAITGAFVGLFVTNTSLSVAAFLGVIILVGVVVNTAIVYVDYANLLRVRGMDLNEALEMAGRRRLRPVLMTSLTTAMGMLPMATAAGEGSEMWQPMGRAALGGLLLSTFVTLLLVPAIYSLLEGLRSKRRFQRLREEARALGVLDDAHTRDAATPDPEPAA